MVSARKEKQETPPHRLYRGIQLCKTAKKLREIERRDSETNRETDYQSWLYHRQAQWSAIAIMARIKSCRNYRKKNRKL